MKIFRWNFNPVPSWFINRSLRKYSLYREEVNLWDKIVVKTWNFFEYWPWKHIQHKLMFRETGRLERELGYNQEEGD